MKTGVLFICLLLFAGIAAAQERPFQSIDPKSRLEFQIAPDEIADLRDLLMRFADSEELTVEDLGARMPPRNGRALFWLKLVHRGSGELEVTNIRKPNLMFVWIYEQRPSPAFDASAAKLEQALREKWPDLAPYTGL